MIKDLKDLTVLMVEPSQEFSEAFRTWVNETGGEDTRIVAVDNCVRAMGLLEKTHPDIVLVAGGALGYKELIEAARSEVPPIPAALMSMDPQTLAVAQRAGIPVFDKVAFPDTAPMLFAELLLPQ